MTTKNPTTPLVSVIIPTWNGEAWLGDTIESVLNQSFIDFELIITDDASDDDTVRAARNYLGDHRVSVHPFSKNLGIGGNWNRGISLAKGSYIKVLCQDDVIDKECIAERVRILSAYDSVTLATSYGRVLGDRTAVHGPASFPGTGELGGSRSREQILHSGNWIGAPSAVMFRRRDLEKTGLFDDTLPCSLDWDMWVRLLTIGNLYVIPDVLYSTRSHGRQESMRCIRILGFEKDKVTIISRMRRGDKRYGSWKEKELKQAWKQSVQDLIRMTLYRPSVPLMETTRFLNRYQSAARTWLMTGNVIMAMTWNKARRYLKSTGGKITSGGEE